MAPKINSPLPPPPIPLEKKGCVIFYTLQIKTQKKKNIAFPETLLKIDDWKINRWDFPPHFQGGRQLLQ